MTAETIVRTHRNFPGNTGNSAAVDTSKTTSWPANNALWIVCVVLLVAAMEAALFLSNSGLQFLRWTGDRQNRLETWNGLSAGTNSTLGYTRNASLAQRFECTAENTEGGDRLYLDPIGKVAVSSIGIVCTKPIGAIRPFGSYQSFRYQIHSDHNNAAEARIEFSSTGQYNISVQVNSTAELFWIDLTFAVAVPVCTIAEQQVSAKTLVRFRKIKHDDSLSGSRVEYCTSRCQLFDFSDPASHSLVKGTTIFTVGNSHIRNMFRCIIDTLVSQYSKEFIDICNVNNTAKIGAHKSRKRGSHSHCFSCQNVSPLHNFDYLYIEKRLNISLHNYWNVNWGFTAYDECDVGFLDVAKRMLSGNVLLDANIKCQENSRFPNTLLYSRFCFNSTESESFYRTEYNDPGKMTDWQKCKAKKLSSRTDYVGIREGRLFFKNSILPRLSADGKSYLVFNAFREPGIIYDFINFIESDPKIRGVKSKLILVIDPEAPSKFNDAVIKWRDSGMLAIDLRQVYRDYTKKGMQESGGPGWVQSHIYSPLQRLLVNHVLSAIAFNNYKQIKTMEAKNFTLFPRYQKCQRI